MDDFLNLLLTHQWLPFTALLIGSLVRLLKSDTPFPITIAPKYRAWAALGLGIVSGVLTAVIAHQPWIPALIEGLLAALTSITGHELIVEGLRNGREFFEPKV